MAAEILTGIKATIHRKTKQIVLWTSLLHEPFLALYAWIPFILRKDLGATAFQVGLLITLKPLVSVFSFYWISATQKKSLRTNLLFLGILGRVPFLLFFWIDQVGFIIFAAALYLLLARAAIAPWMEILKQNLPDKVREKIFTWGSALGYAEGIFLAISLGILLDVHPSSWKFLFFISGAIGIMAVILQTKAPIDLESFPTENRKEITRLRKFFLQPWKDCIQLIKSRKDFAQFQWGFMACGCGIMIAIAILPLYFVDVLDLSHVTFATARQICMGTGFVFSSPFWARALSQQTIARLTFFVCLAFALFSGSLLLAKTHLLWLYVAYVIYGIAQGGSHNLWHLSGPMFSAGESSHKYTGVNVITVAVRGAVIPGVSIYLYSLFGASWTLITSMGICLLGGLFMLKNVAVQKATKNEA